MTTITISLPDSMSEYLHAELKNRGIEDPSEYFRRLLLEDQKKKERERLDNLLEEASNSGESDFTEQDWQDIREEVHRRIADKA